MKVRVLKLYVNENRKQVSSGAHDITTILFEKKKLRKSFETTGS
jgi:hypothetical protein